MKIMKKKHNGKEQRRREALVSRVISLQHEFGSIMFTPTQLRSMYASKLKELERTLKDILQRGVI